MEKQLEKLNQIGFRKVGEWALSNNDKERIVTLKLGKEYYNKGIISFSKKHADFLPKTSGIKVKLIIQQDNIIFPTYTISGEKRIINGNNDLNKWYQRNHQLNDTIRIEIISETEFRICD